MLTRRMDGLEPYGQPSPPWPAGVRLCPGDGTRGCLVYISLDKERCRFCKKTVALREGAVIP